MLIVSRLAARADNRTLTITDMAAKLTKASKILVGGGSGFVGIALRKALEKRGYDVTLISRTPGHSKITWDELRKTGELPQCDAVINLASASVMDAARRWTAEFKAEIAKSSVGTTQLLTDLILKMENPPKVWISASAVGYYPTSLTAEYTEDSPRPTEHTYFTKHCSDLEDAGCLPSDHPCRHVVVRIGLILGREGGTIKSLYSRFWFGVGGTVGSGQQIHAWIHISDVVGIFVHALENESVSGVLNATSPEPVTNAEFTKQFASALWRPAFIPIPAAIMNWIFGSERATVLTEGQKVIPKRTLESGYSFLFPDIKSCFHDLFN